MRRAIDQLLQELVVSKVKEHIFPDLREKLEHVEPPGGTPLPPAVMKKVAQLVFDTAEGQVRKQVHSRFLQAFTAASTAVVPPGCGVLKEAGKEQEVEY